MHRYAEPLKQEIRSLRSLGYTYGEISRFINKNIPKSSLADICKHVKLPDEYQSKIANLNSSNLDKGRKTAFELNKVRRLKYLKSIRLENEGIAPGIQHLITGKIALAMLCLGEASKSYSKSQCFTLGSSDYRIIVIFLELLKKYYNFKIEKIRCTVQCRADQDTQVLEEYWSRVSQIPRTSFYRARIDPRTVGKPTLNNDYKGVLRVDYLDRNVQLQLESLAQLVYTQLLDGRIENEGR